MNGFYVTTPIYYVNDRPHIGHAYTTILADVLARYHRLIGRPTFFLTGADEHGQKVRQAAERAGLTPQEQADRTVTRFLDLWKRLAITNDDFLRTTESRHKQAVQAILQDLYDRGEIYRAEYDGWYDVTSETFVTEKDLPEGRRPEEMPHITRVKESNYFFRMSAYQEWLIRHIEENPGFIQPSFRRNETLGFLRKPLNDLCISRPKTRMDWGIELPFDKDYVCYVWFDALVNYISAIGYRRDPELFAQWWPASCQLIGKDILTTHTVYWPTMLKAMGLPMPETVFAHGWWLSGDTKMSKSLGNVVDPMAMIDRFGTDAFRYFLIAEMTPGQDATFTEEAFRRRYNADLANDLGNLLSRLLNMIGRYCKGRIPSPAADAPNGPDERTLWQEAHKAADGLRSSVEAFRLNEGVNGVVALIRSVNRYLEVKQPWTAAKADDPTDLHTTLYTAAEALRVASALLYPVMPEKMPALRKAIGLGEDSPQLDGLTEWGQLKPGAPIVEAGPLFPRAEAPEAGEASETTPSAQSKKTEEQKMSTEEKTPATNEDTDGAGLIAYEAFEKVQLRTARIVSAEPIEGATKLLKLEVFMGDERRQLVAGIALHYAPEDLIGKTVVVVANLKPAKLRGVLSQGMILAASKGERLRLITVDGDLASGATVK